MVVSAWGILYSIEDAGSIATRFVFLVQIKSAHKETEIFNALTHRTLVSRNFELGKIDKYNTTKSILLSNAPLLCWNRVKRVDSAVRNLFYIVDSGTIKK